jgi:acetyl-CoA C-acetyltransferase
MKLYRPSHELVIVGAARTPQGPLDGAVAAFSAIDLGAIAIRAALERAGVAPDTVDEVVMGNVISSGLLQAPAKQAAVAAGMPQDRESKTVNTVCASGMTAIADACISLDAGNSEIAVAGGMESRSNAPYLLGPFCGPGQRLPGKLRRAEFHLRPPRRDAPEEAQRDLAALIESAHIFEASVHDSLLCPFDRAKAMKDYAEEYAKSAGITIDEINTAAAGSYRKAREANRSGALDDEIAPAGNVRSDDIISEEREADVRAVSYGYVTAYNAPALGDGAAALVLMRRDTAQKRGRTPLARILGIARVETGPSGFVHAPVEAVNALQDALSVRPAVLEANESFGLQLPLLARELRVPILNPFGGSVAITHPVGASGARVVVTLTHALRRFNERLGAATICYGSGGAMAVMLERL